VVIDIGSSLKRLTEKFYACIYGVDANRTYMSNRFDTPKTRHGFSSLRR